MRLGVVFEANIPQNDPQIDLPVGLLVSQPRSKTLLPIGKLTVSGQNFAVLDTIREFGWYLAIPIGRQLLALRKPCGGGSGEALEKL